MTIDDYDSVHRLWLSCTGMGLNDLDDSKKGIAAFLDRNPATCFVCIDEGAVVGAIIAGHDGRRGYIYHTAVSPEHRRRGIGKGLADHALIALRNEGINKVAMLVFARNEAGNAFWEHEGFAARTDVVYRNKALADLIRLDT